MSDLDNAWGSLTSAIGAAKGLSTTTVDDVEHLSVDQRLKVAEIHALLAIGQQLNHVRHAVQGHDVKD